MANAPLPNPAGDITTLGRIGGRVIEFTRGQNWFEGQIHVWEKVLAPKFASMGFCRGLELGSWEGGSASWFLLNLCSGADLRNRLTCIDHFDGLRTAAGRARRRRMGRNLAATGRAERAEILEGFTIPRLMGLLADHVEGRRAGFNFVYVDASHRADDALLDAELAWRMLVKGGVLVFDDVEWPQEDDASIRHPKRGARAFLDLHRGELEVLHAEYQIIIEKLVPMRHGFLL